jgi:hypothetical protein
VRILNSADPDAPNARQVAQTIALYLGHHWEEVLPDEAAPGGLGDHPWDFRSPVVLGTMAALELGCEPAGTHAATMPQQIDWLLNTAASGADPAANDPFFGPFLDYGLEDTIVNP